MYQLTLLSWLPPNPVCKVKKSSILYALYSLPKPQPNEVNAATCRQISLILTACKSLPSLNAAIFHQTSGDCILRTSCSFPGLPPIFLGIHLGDRILSIRLTSSASAAEWKQPCWGLLALGLSSFLFRPILLLFREPHWSSLCISCAQTLFWALEIQPWTKQTQTPALMELTFPWERQTTNKINK